MLQTFWAIVVSVSSRVVSTTSIMAIWVVEFLNGGSKIRTSLLLTFENWVNGEVSNNGHHFRK